MQATGFEPVALDWQNSRPRGVTNTLGSGVALTVGVVDEKYWTNLTHAVLLRLWRVPVQ